MTAPPPGIKITVISPRAATITFQALADPTGELNDIVWKTMGHLRGSFSHYHDTDSLTQDDSNAIRYPRPQVITIPFPENLQLNELYWPSLRQHASELWVVLPCYDMNSIAGQLRPVGTQPIIKIDFGNIVPAYEAVVAGIWHIDPYEDSAETSIAFTRADSSFQQLALVCFTDARIGQRNRIDWLGDAFLYADDAASTLYDNTGGTYPLIDSQSGYESSARPDNQLYSGAYGMVPCRMTVYKNKPIYSVWHDACNIGLGAWPWIRPGFYNTSYFPYTLLGAASFTVAGAWGINNPIYELEDIHTAAKVRVNPFVTNAIRFDNASDPASYTFPGALASVYGIKRRDGIAVSNAPLLSMQESRFSQLYIDPITMSSRATTALFVNVNTSGQYTGQTSSTSLYISWLATQNAFRYLAATRPGRKVVIDISGVNGTERNEYWNEVRFPPSAWIVRLSAAATYQDSRPWGPVAILDGEYDAALQAVEIEEMPWDVSGLCSEFPITWSRSAAGIDYIDSGQVGECYRVYYNFNTGEWKRKRPGWTDGDREGPSILFTYNCEAVRYVGYSVLTQEQEDDMDDYCETTDIACYPPIIVGYDFDQYYWRQRPCTAMVMRTNQTPLDINSEDCWEMIWGASYVYRVTPPPPEDPEPPTPPPPTPPNEPVPQPQPGLPVPPGYL